jgi:TolB-like protein/DNA-binding winged helix-turn-helix (wHTH) protein
MFGEFELDLGLCELRRHSRRVKLERIPMDLLMLLVENRGRLVTREEIVTRLWGRDTFVDTENNVNAAVRKIRQALRDSPDRPVFLRTITGRGYCFIATVSGGPEFAQTIDVAPPASIPVATPQAAEIQRRPVRPEEQDGGTRRRVAIAAGLGAVFAIGGTYGLYERRRGPRRIESIAVLPLENLTGNPSYEYFSDGMTDELIGELARIGSLQVISRTSVMQYKGSRNKSLPAIARELNVQSIVEGTVSQSAGKVRITARLIGAEDERHIWSGRYERELADVLALQDDVARAIAREIRVNLPRERDPNPARPRRVSPEAFEAYLKGTFYLNKGILGISRSIDSFNEAIKLDQNAAESYAGLAEALCYEGIFEIRPSAETYPQARAAALKALDLDSSNAAAHNALADVIKGYDWDLQGALVEYRRAFQLNPSHLLTRLWYADCLARLGHYDDALTETEKALALDPVSPVGRNLRSMVLWRARRYDEAIDQAQQALSFDSNFVNAYWWQSQAWASKGNFVQSITCLTKAITLDDGPLFLTLLGHVYGRAGEKDKAHAVLNQLIGLSGRQFVSPMNFALLYGGLNDPNKTFRWLEKARDSRTTRVHELSWPYFDNLHGDPRYANLIRRIGLPL